MAKKVTGTTKQKHTPCAPHIPTAATAAAMKAGRAGRIRQFKSLDELMSDLNQPRPSRINGLAAK